MAATQAANFLQLNEEQAPYLEPTSYLVKTDGSGCLNAVGREVVFIKEGYFEQCRVVQQPPLEPRWTSVGVRQWQSRWLTGSKAARQQDGIGYCRLGLVEKCKVVGITYHHRLLPEKQLEKTSSGQHSEGIWDPPGNATVGTSAAESGAAGAEQATLQLQQVSEASAPAASDASDDDEEDEGPQFFVRVTLQRLPQKNDRLGPVCTVIDHYVDSGVGEWLIPRDRYESTMERRWRQGDRIQMYWADQASSGRGQWWLGTVVGYVQRRPEDVFRDSPWAAVTIRWRDTNSSDNISPWELSPPDDDDSWIAGDESDMESDWDLGETQDASADEDWDLTELDARKQGGSRDPRSCRSVSVGSIESEESLEYERARKRQRSAAAAGFPETMLPKSSKGTVDWNKGHCAACMAVPDGSLVLECDGTCLRSFHSRCLAPQLQPTAEEWEGAPWFCGDCREGVAACAACKEKGGAGLAVLKCRLGSCGNYFHAACLRRLAAATPCVKIHRDGGDASTSSGRVDLQFTCASHFCDRCHLSGDSLKIFRCWTCLKAFHGKCMDRTERRLNEKEMECKDCAAARTGCAAAAAAAPARGPSSVQPSGVAVWQPSKAPVRPQAKISKWTASITNLQTNRTTDLVGKAIFHFGSHKKGGGCDFLVPLQNVKFHSELKVLADGNVVLSYCHRKARELSEIIITNPSQQSHILNKPEQLQDGALIAIASTDFRFWLRPWEPCHTPLLLI